MKNDKMTEENNINTIQLTLYKLALNDIRAKRNKRAKPLYD
jgi:hypothetical protein